MRDTRRAGPGRAGMSCPVGLHVAVDRAAAPGQSCVVHLVERDPAARKLIGGITVEVRID